MGVMGAEWAKAAGVHIGGNSGSGPGGSAGSVGGVRETADSGVPGR